MKGVSKFAELNDPEWLQLQYHGWGKDTYQIADELAASPRSVQRAMIRLDVPRRPHTERKLVCPKLRDHELIRRLYLEDNLSAAQIAGMVGCSNSAALNELKRAGVEIRSRGERAHVRQCPDLDLVLSEEALRFVEGELLGDGHIGESSDYSASYQHSSKYHSYLSWLGGEMRSFGLEQAGSVKPYPNGYGGVIWTYRTRSYPALMRLRERWYPKGKKIIPNDLVLGPTTVKQWFTGDGCRHERDGRSPLLTFATYGFTLHDRLLLVEKLRELGIEATVQGAGRLYVRARSQQALFDYMGSCEVECYQYKWPEAC